MSCAASEGQDGSEYVSYGGGAWFCEPAGGACRGGGAGRPWNDVIALYRAATIATTTINIAIQLFFFIKSI
jgi:hypothetical protein